MLLSVLMPAYHEEKTLGEVLRRVLAVDLTALAQPIELEIIVVDDGSTDRTLEIAFGLAGPEPRIKVLRHDQHRGVGAAIRTALGAAAGEYCIIQDAALEYDIRDYPDLLAPVLHGADAVYGSRFLASPRPGTMPAANFVANRILSVTATLLYGMPVSDEASYFKILRTALMRELDLTSTGFEIGSEITAKLGLRGAKIVEVPIAYTARATEPLHRPHWTDGTKAMWTLLKHRIAGK